MSLSVASIQTETSEKLIICKEKTHYLVLIHCLSFLFPFQVHNILLHIHHSHLNLLIWKTKYIVKWMQQTELNGITMGEQLAITCNRALFDSIIFSKAITFLRENKPKKFQPNPTISQVKFSPGQTKNQSFLGNEKLTPKYSSKKQVCKISA